MAHLLPLVLGRVVTGSATLHRQMREMVTERFMSAASVGTLVAAITALNDDVHQFVVGALSGDPLTQLSFVRSSALHIDNVMTITLASYAADNMMLALFGLGALVLLGLMLRA